MTSVIEIDAQNSIVVAAAAGILCVYIILLDYTYNIRGTLQTAVHSSFRDQIPTAEMRLKHIIRYI